MDYLRSHQKRDRETEHLQFSKKAKFDETPLAGHPARPEHQNMTFMNLN
ncbi:hypothetical protein [Tychonema sp. LEGE 07203]|nr:hypothetical protein [Tychonema sp. LEGE 07203]MBE9094787.1 hypothetical protein [Tychonema sp. LEGE 07203]